MNSFETALCHALRRPVMPGMRGSEQFYAARTKLERIMKAAADKIERDVQAIADLNLLASYAPASCDTHPKDGDGTKIAAPLVSGAVPEGQTPTAQSSVSTEPGVE